MTGRRRTGAQWTLALVAIVGALASVWQSTPVPLDAQPFPDAQVYADTAYQIANGNGFRTTVDEHRSREQWRAGGALQPGRNPPGFSLALAPFVRWGHNDLTDTQTGTRVIALALVLANALAAALLGGPVAAGIAALVSWASPFGVASARLVISDAFGAWLAVTILALLAVASHPRIGARGRDASLVGAGLLAGYGVLTRISAVFILAALVAAVRGWRQRLLVVSAAMPALLFLAGVQWSQFGSPLRTGYDHHLPGLRPFALVNVRTENLFGERGAIVDDRLHGALMRWTCPCDEHGPMGKASNLVFYPAVVLGLYWIYFPPLFAVLAVPELARTRHTVAARFAAGVVVGNLALMFPYFYQAARFVAPAAVVVLPYASACVARLLLVAARYRPS